MRKVDLKKRFWQEFQKLPKSIQTQPLFLAVSGGMDSTVLAHVVLSLKQRLPAVHFVHVNYGFRPPYCDQEEAFLKQWAQQEGIAFHLKRFCLKTKPRNLQDWARQRRYTFFGKVLSDEGRGTLVLAHHQMDQVETFLTRLLTGSGLKALGGMKLWEPRYLFSQKLCFPVFRPFLSVSKTALECYATSHQLTYHEDHSNAELDYLRNRLRHQVWPLLERENPQAAETFARTARLASEAQALIETQASEWLKRHGKTRQGRVVLPRSTLARLAPALRQTVLEFFLRSHLPNTRNLGKTLDSLDPLLKKPLKYTLILKEKLELILSGENLWIQKRKKGFRG